MTSEKMGESYCKLRWNVKGLFDNLSVITNELEMKLDSIPIGSTRKRAKLERLITQIKYMEETIHIIKNNKIRDIEKNFDYKFIEPNLIVLAFFQPETRSLFTDLKNQQFLKEKNFDFEPYLNLDEAAKVLAFVIRNYISRMQPTNV